jgi:hypothetical protein
MFASGTSAQSHRRVVTNINTSGSPAVFSTDGEYLGNVNNNRYDPNSVANPYGRYGSKYSSESINNPYGRYGSKYSSEGAANPYGSTESPRIYDRDGNYLGRINQNSYDPESVANPYGSHGSRYSPTSIKNPYSAYGNPYNSNSATSKYGTGSSFEIKPLNTTPFGR